jgi:hypothetical protein
MSNFLREIDALGRYVYRAATLKSMRLTEAPPTVARPVILWENPQRGRSRNLDQYTYVVRVQQFGKLFVNSFDQAAIYQDSLISYLEEKYGVLEVYENDQSTQVVALLKAVTIEFNPSETLDIPINVTYEATYSRKRPVDPGPASFVGNKIETKF